jgi:hypothetical protein
LFISANVISAIPGFITYNPNIHQIWSINKFI